MAAVVVRRAVSDLKRLWRGVAVACLAGLAGSAAAVAGEAPEIRLNGVNRVPACVTPERLTAYLKSRNEQLDPRFAQIAHWYRHWGEAWRVRWDYAFFQMAVETNFLSYRRGNGAWGDVDPRQNNFAGIGTTGGGVPGDRFPDVKTGVLGHIQHLVAYSGERLAQPVAPRTQLKQNDIVEVSLRLRRPVRFSDLARRWAVDKNYWASISAVADRFFATQCAGQGAPGFVTATLAPPMPKLVASRTPPVAAAAPGGPMSTPPTPVPPMPVAARPQPATCRIGTASFGGTRALLIRSEANGEARFTAVQVLDGFEQSMADSFIRTHAPGGVLLGTFENRERALSHARSLCPAV